MNIGPKDSGSMTVAEFAPFNARTFLVAQGFTDAQLDAILTLWDERPELLNLEWQVHDLRNKFKFPPLEAFAWGTLRISAATAALWRAMGMTPWQQEHLKAVGSLDGGSDHWLWDHDIERLKLVARQPVTRDWLVEAIATTTSWRDFIEKYKTDHPEIGAGVETLAALNGIN